MRPYVGAIIWLATAGDAGLGRSLVSLLGPLATAGGRCGDAGDEGSHDRVLGQSPFRSRVEFRSRFRAPRVMENLDEDISVD